MFRIDIAALVFVVAACTPSVVVPSEALRYAEPYEVAFPAVVEAASVVRIENEPSFELTEANPGTGVVQLRVGAPSDATAYNLTILVNSIRDDGTSVFVRAGSTTPVGRELAAEYARILITEIDARLTRRAAT